MKRLAPPIDSEEAAELYVDEVLDGAGRFVHLDKVASVSGLIRFDLVTDRMRPRQILLPKEDPHGF